MKGFRLSASCTVPMRRMVALPVGDGLGLAARALPILQSSPATSAVTIARARMRPEPDRPFAYLLATVPPVDPVRFMRTKAYSTLACGGSCGQAMGDGRRRCRGSADQRPGVLAPDSGLRSLRSIPSHGPDGSPRLKGAHRRRQQP